MDAADEKRHHHLVERQVERKQRAAQDGQPHLRKDDAKEGRHRRPAQAARGFHLRPVERTQRAADEHHHERNREDAVREHQSGDRAHETELQVHAVRGYGKHHRRHDARKDEDRFEGRTRALRQPRKSQRREHADDRRYHGGSQRNAERIPQCVHPVGAREELAVLAQPRVGRQQLEIRRRAERHRDHGDDRRHEEKQHQRAGNHQRPAAERGARGGFHISCVLGSRAST